MLPFFRKLETDTDIRDDFHGFDGPIPVRRHKREAWLPLQEAFHEACLDGGYAEVYDHNHPDSTGVGPFPMNNPNGVRMKHGADLREPKPAPAESDYQGQREGAAHFVRRHESQRGGG